MIKVLEININICNRHSNLGENHLGDYDTRVLMEKLVLDHAFFDYINFYQYTMTNPQHNIAL